MILTTTAPRQSFFHPHALECPATKLCTFHPAGVQALFCRNPPRYHSLSRPNMHVFSILVLQLRRNHYITKIKIIPTQTGKATLALLARKSDDPSLA